MSPRRPHTSPVVLIVINANQRGNIKLISVPPAVICSRAQTPARKIGFKWISPVICKQHFYWTWKLYNYVCGLRLPGLLCKAKSVSDMTVIRRGLHIHTLADRGLQCVAGPTVIPGRNTQAPRQFNYALLCPLIPGGAIRNQGLPCVETFVAILLKTFSRESRSAPLCAAPRL